MKTIYKKRLALLLLMIIFLFPINVFASEDDSEISVREKMVFDRYYNEVTIYIQNSDVKMTQDHDYYYFEISQDMVNNTSFDSSFHLNYVTDMIVSNMTDLRSLRIRIDEYMNTIQLKQQVYYGFIEGESIRGQVSNYHINQYGEIKKNSNSKDYYIANTNLVYNNPNASMISLTKTGLGTLGEVFNVTTKFKVKKENISSLRYFSVLFNKVYSKYNSSGNLSGTVKCGVPNYVIDLLQYIDCDHDFELRYCDDERHSIYCKNCEWLINDYHDFNIEYDNIENDECICGLRKQIRLTHNNNLNDLAITKLATPNEVIEYADDFDYIKGHTLLHYEDLELIDNDWDLATKSIIATLPNAVPKNSHTYTAMYKVNSYYINYSNVNNLNLQFDNQMAPVKLDYGQKFNLDENQYKKTGYNFLGWAIRPDITKEVFDDKEEIESLTDIDDAIVTLHPVFSPYEYTIHYIDNRYGQNYYKKYSYADNLPLDINYKLKTSDTFEGFRINGKIQDVRSTFDILKYIINDHDTLTLESSYIVDINEHDIGTNDIRIISESNEVRKEFNNELPIVAKSEVTNILKDKTKNKKEKLIDYDSLFDDNYMDVFLSANIKLLGNVDKKLINYNNWMSRINKFIIYLKEILLNNILLSNILKFVMIFSVFLVLALLIIFILYMLKKDINSEKSNKINTIDKICNL